ncbi:hypothetical protein CMUS01_10518 [Colletotrichum musicola]|uniref:Uncharacterized protein n=1 Tax=Colletotrichum musicola TaxID=2175873 RepID=A0A8H6K3R0_9PEZI|nr:hypothetical protein CMUS01_10518 [Colletotrichum musicola]
MRSNILVLASCATTTTALVLPGLGGGSLPGVNAPVGGALPFGPIVPNLGVPEGVDGILQILGLTQIDTQLLQLNTSITGLDSANLQTRIGGLTGLLGGLTQSLGLGSLNQVLGIVDNIVGPLLSGLGTGSPLQLAYNNALGNLPIPTTGSIPVPTNLPVPTGGSNPVPTLTLQQSQAVIDALKLIAGHYAQILNQLEAKKGAFDALSGTSLPAKLKSTVQGILGGTSTTPVNRVQTFLQQTLTNNNGLVDGLLPRVDSTLQGTLASLRTTLENLVNLRVTVYGVPTQ